MVSLVSRNSFNMWWASHCAEGFKTRHVGAHFRFWCQRAFIHFMVLETTGRIMSTLWTFKQSLVCFCRSPSAGLAQWEDVTEGRDSESAGPDFWSGQLCTFLHQETSEVLFLCLTHPVFQSTHADCLPAGFGPDPEEVCELTHEKYFIY